MKKRQISITAETGVGSTSAVKELKLLLPGKQWRWASGGDIFREMATKATMSVEEFSRHVCQLNEVGGVADYDHLVDNRIARMARSHNFICEGRLVHYFMPCAFHVLLTCPEEKRAERRHRDYPHLKYEEVLEKIRRRDENDRARYRRLYPDALWEDGRFDLKIDTSVVTSPSDVARLIYDGYQVWIE